MKMPAMVDSKSVGIFPNKCGVYSRAIEYLPYSCRPAVSMGVFLNENALHVPFGIPNNRENALDRIDGAA